MKKNWYQLEGSKTKEFISILHLPYTLMCLSFLTIGFAIEGVRSWFFYSIIFTAYFLGLGIAAHCFDQITGMGSRYVKYLNDIDLLNIGFPSLVISVSIGYYFMKVYGFWNLLWLIPLQTFFVFSYPLSKLFKGKFHTDFWFAFSFGAVPVIVGNYINTFGFSYISVAWALLCFVISYIEITLSRYVRKKRLFGREYIYNELKISLFDEIEKPELALKLLCVMSYLLALIMVFSHKP